MIKAYDIYDHNCNKNVHVGLSRYDALNNEYIEYTEENFFTNRDRLRTVITAEILRVMSGYDVLRTNRVYDEKIRLRNSIIQKTKLNFLELNPYLLPIKSEREAKIIRKDEVSSLVDDLLDNTTLFDCIIESDNKNFFVVVRADTMHVTIGSSLGFEKLFQEVDTLGLQIAEFPDWKIIWYDDDETWKQ